MKKRQWVVLAAFSMTIVGCISSNGAMQPNTQFVYPNSNVRPISGAHASKSHEEWGLLFFAPTFSASEIRDVYRRALEESDAELLINFSEKMTVSHYILFNTVAYSIEGIPARMQVGEQRIFEWSPEVQP